MAVTTTELRRPGHPWDDRIGTGDPPAGFRKRIRGEPCHLHCTPRQLGNDAGRQWRPHRRPGAGLKPAPVATPRCLGVRSGGEAITPRPEHTASMSTASRRQQPSFALCGSKTMSLIAPLCCWRRHKPRHRIAPGRSRTSKPSATANGRRTSVSTPGYRNRWVIQVQWLQPLMHSRHESRAPTAGRAARYCPGAILDETFCSVPKTCVYSISKYSNS